MRIRDENLPDDRELVQKLLARDEEAQKLFYIAYRERLYQACVYILGSQDPDAEDLAQEAFIIALRKLPGFEFRSSLFRWLYGICVYLCFEHIRKRRRQVVHMEEELESLSGAFAVENERRHEDEAEKQGIIRLVRAQRDLMGDPCQGLLRLRDEEGNSYAGIAEALKIPIGTVMSRLARCKEALKQLVLKAFQEESHA